LHRAPVAIPQVAGASSCHHGRMAQWARRHGQLFAEWHLLGAASRGAVNRGQLVAACGENLGDEESMLERVDDESVIGNRCPACQGIALSRS
jgi:hypothetical protein